MLKHDIENYDENFKHLFPLKYNTHRFGNVWLEQLNVCVKYGILSNKDIGFIG